MKKLFVLFAVVLSVMLVQCTDNSTQPVFNSDNGNASLAKGTAGGGSHTETLTNNLSFPALLADGFEVVPIAATTFLVPYDGPYTGLTQEQIDYVLATGPYYAQKVEGNVWQAEYASVDAVDITFIDWGDAIESVDPKINRPFRLELSLYNQLAVPMTGYKMAELAFPSSPDETQGTNTTTYAGEYAAVASPLGRLVVQRFDDGATLTWNGSSWDGAYAPETGFGFMMELNVGGKLIYGASQGGWKPRIAGNYRITFYLEGGTVNLSNAQIGDYGTPPVVPKISENNQPYVDAANNLSYVDVQAVSGGGN